ncbi:MAG TPA: FAD-dependent oxidoreductase [Acidobacteriaceae bacterium]|jgi:protoporphyrinogen oxidase|nr:FAD-dependent oxidoreductase [Acidobacteriaceae bacterium]
MEKIAILGSGMAGFGAAHRLHEEGMPSVVYDRNSYLGGHTASFRHETGFIFDEGPHVSFTKHERLQKYFADNVGQKYEVIHSHPNNYWKGYWIKHPAICNLSGLPTDLVVNCLRDFIEAQHKQQAEGESSAVRTYAEWLYASYGRTFAETFPMEYGYKFHTTTADNMSIDWLGPRLYRAKLEEVLAGAVSRETRDVHYVDYVRYPTYEGFVNYLSALPKETTVQLGYQVVRINPKERTLQFANGEVADYDAVISSVPLTDLIPMIAGAPEDVVAAAARLACTSCVLVNLGVDRADLCDGQWTYFYDRDICFTRLSFPHMFSPHTAPPGCGGIQAEVYFSRKYRPLQGSPQDCVEPVLRDLKRCGILRETDKIVHTSVSVCGHAQVIFDLERADALAVVHGYLDDIGVAYCGRYGDWLYTWTDEAFMSGENAAQKTLERLAVGKAK